MPPTVFLSAATVDLKEWRDVLDGAFRRAGFHVLTHEHSLGSALGNVKRLLSDTIAGAAAIASRICAGSVLPVKSTARVWMPRVLSTRKSPGPFSPGRPTSTHSTSGAAVGMALSASVAFRAVPATSQESKSGSAHSSVLRMARWSSTMNNFGFMTCEASENRDSA